MNKFFIPILIFLVIIFGLYKTNNKSVLSNKNEYETFVSDILSDNQTFNTIEEINEEIYDIKYKKFINLMKSYYSEIEELLIKHCGLSIREEGNTYDSFIKKTSDIDIIDEYYSSKMYQKIFNLDEKLSYFLLFVNPSHQLNITFTNDNDVNKNFRTNNLRLLYQIKDITPNKTESPPFTQEVYFGHPQEDHEKILQDNINSISKIATLLYEGGNVLNVKQYSIHHELPTRPTGNIKSKDENSNVVTSFLYLLPGKYEFELILESKELLKEEDIMNFSSLSFVDIIEEKFNISEDPDKFTKEGAVVKNIIINLDVYVFLVQKLIEILSIDDTFDYGGDELNYKIVNKDNTEDDIKLYLYSFKNNKHSKKIKELVSCIIYIINNEIDKYLNIDNPKYLEIIEKQENIELINQIMNFFYDDVNFQPFSNYIQEMKKIFPKDDDNTLKSKYLESEFKEDREYIKNLVDKFSKIIEIKKNTDEIKTDLDNLIKKIIDKNGEIKSIPYFVYKKKYIVNVIGDELPNPNFIPEKDLSFLEIKPRKVLKSIQDDLRVALNERGNKKLDNYLSQDTISSLKRIDAISKLKDIDQKEEREGNIKLKEIIMNILDKIKSGDYNLVTKFLDYDIKNFYQFPNPVIEEFISKEELMKRHPIKYTRGQKKDENNISKTIEIKNRNKNKMDTIYKRLDMIRSKNNLNKVNYNLGDEEKLTDIINKGMNAVNRKDDIIEGFLPHKHTKEGQIRWNIDPKLDNEQWLKKNYNTVSDYKFIPKENKEQILKSYDDMEKNIKDTIAFISETYNNYDERINIYEVEKQKKINEAQNNLNSRDYERERLEFEQKEKEQDLKTKLINQKLEELDKITNKVNLNDSFKSISSYGDGQTLSIENIEKNIYTIKANKGCLSFDDNNLLNSGVCNGNDRQQFLITNIKNNEEYNNHIKTPVDEYAEVFYPFSIVKSKDNENKCLSMKGSSLGIHDCQNTIYQRWDTKKLEKECRGDYSS